MWVLFLVFFPLIRVVVDFRPGEFSSGKIIGDYFSTVIAVAKIYHHLYRNINENLQILRLSVYDLCVTHITFCRDIRVWVKFHVSLQMLHTEISVLSSEQSTN